MGIWPARWVTTFPAMVSSAAISPGVSRSMMWRRTEATCSGAARSRAARPCSVRLKRAPRASPGHGCRATKPDLDRTRTSRIKVASRVLAVPFRRPAMVAKLAASLDLLSGGRFILGLGAGYSDEEITAVGGPVLSPGEKIDGLAEAIQVIRGTWTHSGYSQHGRHHSVRDLEMEPKPIRPIPVWLGTFGPRALAVTGRLADGWIPSLGYMPVEEIP